MRLVKALIERLLEKSPALPASPVPSASGTPGPQGLDLLDAGFLKDPYPFYAYLRAHDPVHRTKQGSWLLTRHADIAAAFSNLLLGNAPSTLAVLHARNREKYVSASVAGNILPFLDKPEQTEPRRAVASAFRAALRDTPPNIDAAALQRLHALSDRPVVDLINDYAEPLSVWTISELLGLPHADAPLLLKWAAAFFYLFAPMPTAAIREAADTALAEFRLYLGEALRLRSGRPGGDVISRLLAADGEDRRLDEAQIIDNCMLLFADGVENVDRGVGNTLLALHRHPAVMARLQQEPMLAGAAVTEGLRYDPPGQTVARVARDDLELGGRRIARDNVVVLALASANRDTAADDRPDVFSLDRAADTQLTFGRGRHSCIGAPLVQLEMTSALGTLLRHATRIAVDDSSLEWEPRLGHRWLKALPAALTLAR